MFYEEFLSVIAGDYKEEKATEKATKKATEEAAEAEKDIYFINKYLEKILKENNGKKVIDITRSTYYRVTPISNIYMVQESGFYRFDKPVNMNNEEEVKYLVIDIKESL